MTRDSRHLLAGVVVALAAVLALPFPAYAQGPGSGGLAPQHNQPKTFRPEAGITEQIGVQVPLDTVFRDENDKQITFGEAMGGRTTILVPVYYRCPMLCTKALNGLLDAMRKMPPNFSAGEQFQVVTLSMDFKEHGAEARPKKKAYLNGDPNTGQLGYGRPSGEAGWRFLTGNEHAIAAVLNSVGYKFEFDKMMKEYNHPSALIILSPQGKVTRYFYGIGYDGEFEIDGEPVNVNGKLTRPHTTLRLSLIEAADGKGGSLSAGERLLMLCYRYDALHQGHALNILRIVQVGGVITLLVVGGGILWAVNREGILKDVLWRVALFVLICVAVSGLGLGSSLYRGGDKEFAAVMFGLSFVSIIGITVMAVRRINRGAPTPPAGQDVLPTGGTA